jgi:hypothetical protein
MKTTKFRKAVLGVTIGLLGLAPGGAFGQGFVMNFQFSQFPPSNLNQAPTDPVSGSIAWQASDIHGPIQEFNSISLTLDGHKYFLSDIQYQLGPGSSDSRIYANSGSMTNIPGNLYNLTDGFDLVWDHDSLKPLAFAYTSSQRSGIWSISSAVNPSSFNFFSITQVPEPSSAALAIFGAAILLICRRRTTSEPSHWKISHALGSSGCLSLRSRHDNSEADLDFAVSEIEEVRRP